MIGIKSIATISHLPTFKAENIWSSLRIITPDDGVIAPDYKEYIPASSLRRYSPIIRMAVASALETHRSGGSKNYDAISVGTGLGCLVDTEKFLQQVITAQGGALSPTSFIQSTHNTIGGTISLLLENHAYNMTHTQQFLSFEWALLDAMMKMQEGAHCVLVGGTDEYIPLLEKIHPQILPGDGPLSATATFMQLEQNCPVAIRDLTIVYGSLEQQIQSFLHRNELTEEQIDFVIYGTKHPLATPGISFLPYTGINQCNVAIAYHMAHDAILHRGMKSVLIINNQGSNGIGLGLLHRADV